MMNTKPIPLLLIIALALGGCGTVMVNSQWSAQEVVVNGSAEEWEGAYLPLKEENFSLALRNDERFLYVCFTTSSRQMRSMASMRGLTFWFDSAGSRSKVFGVKYPLGRAATQEALAALSESEREELTQKVQQGDRAARSRIAEIAMGQAVILGPAKDSERKIALAELRLKGIELRMGQARGSFVYELKVPLAVSEETPFAVGASPGQAIGIGIEIPAVRRLSSGGGMGRGMGGGGAGGDEVGGGGGGEGGEGEGGGGGRGGGRGGGMGGPPRRSPMNGLKFWAQVTLAQSIR